MIKNKNTNKAGQCPGNRNETSTGFIGKITDVKTVYARMAILLLAINCALTGYTVYRLNENQEGTVNATDNPARIYRQHLNSLYQADLTPKTPAPPTPATQPAP